MSAGDTSENRAHKTTALASESTRQNDVAKAITAGGGSAAVALAIKQAEVAHYNARDRC
jgi:hypothetical protein